MKKKEIVPLFPGWVDKKYNGKIIKEKYENINEIIMFFLICTINRRQSTSAISLGDFGWKNDVWKKGILRREILKVASLEKEQTLFVFKKLEDGKDVFKKSLSKNFHRNLSVEKIVMYQPSYYNQIESILYHIRNSLAHGRFKIGEYNNESVFVFEDGVQSKGKFEVRSRMILKKSTLSLWINLIKNGPEYLNAK